MRPTFGNAFKHSFNKRQIVAFTSFSGMMFLIFAVVNLQTACSNYYKINTPAFADQQAKAAYMNTMKMERKYFIVHSNGFDFNLSEPIIDKEGMMLRGIKRTIPQNHNIHEHSTKHKNYRFFRRKGQTVVLNEIHLYADQVIANGDSISIPFAGIQKAEMVQLSPVTYLSYVLGIAGTIVGILAFITIIILLTKSSCPFVYMETANGEFNFKGEIFGGAIYPSLERNDILPLGEVGTFNDTVKIVVANELKEKQYIDNVSLTYINYSDSITPVWATNGTIYGVRTSIKPEAAVLNRHQSQLKQLLNTDENFCQFNDTTISGIINTLDLGFKNNSQNRNALLLLKLKNSYWFDYMFGEMTSLFGVSYNKWQEKQRQKPASEHLKWSDNQFIPLSVSVWNGTSWSEISRINCIGPLATRQLAIHVAIPENAGDLLKIRLSCGFMFWEVDEAALSFDYSKNLEEQTAPLVLAVDGYGKDVSKELAHQDNNRLAQLNTGDEADIEFVLPAHSKTTHVAAFLKARGYYEHVRDYKGLPDVDYLKSFLQPGAFARFSRDRYKLLMQTEFKSFNNVPL